MPTGYTAKIEKGQGFKDFVLGCARAMGACTEMRDEAPDAPIPAGFQPSSYHLQEKQEAEKELKRLRSITTAQATKVAIKEFDEEVERRHDRAAEKTELRSKYERMLAKVEAWLPPTAEHNGLKQFMIKQIKESIDFDCGATDYDEKHPIERLTGEEWLARKINAALTDIDHHGRSHAEEVTRVRGRNAWLVALRTSLATGEEQKK